jgi:hypothetical protein
MLTTEARDAVAYSASVRALSKLCRVLARRATTHVEATGISDREPVLARSVIQQGCVAPPLLM